MKIANRIGIIGGGSWATALAKILQNKSKKTNWWFRRSETMDFLQNYKHNPDYLSSVEFNTDLLFLSNDIEEIIKKYINLETVKNTEINYKGRLIEIVQKENLTIEFKTEETRDDEVPFYFTKVFIDNKECGIGNGFKKIKSEQEAAENAYLNLKNRN